MSSLYEGTDLQIETIDSKPYLLQARAVFADGSRSEWGPTAYLPEYVAPAGSIGAVDGTFESYLVRQDLVDDGWILDNSTASNFGVGSLDTTGIIAGAKSLKITANSYSATGEYLLTTPAFDSYEGTSVNWSVKLHPETRGAFKFRVEAFWSTSASVNPTKLNNSGVLTVASSETILPITSGIDNDNMDSTKEALLTGGEITVPDTAKRLSFAFYFSTANSGSAFPEVLYVDDLILVGIQKGPMDTVDDQIITGSKYFQSLAAQQAEVENLTAFDAYIDRLDVHDLSVNGTPLNDTRQTYIINVGDYPRNTAKFNLGTSVSTPATINSLSVYPPDVSTEAPYIATIHWSGWASVTAVGGTTGVSRAIEAYIEERVGYPLNTTWTVIRRVRSAHTDPRFAADTMVRRLVSSPLYEVRVRMFNTGTADCDVQFDDRLQSNSLRMKLEPASPEANTLPTFKPSGLGYDTNGNDAPNGGAGGSDTQVGTKVTATWTGTFGWAESYEGDGSRRFDSARIYQGFLGAEKGNQKSAMGNLVWSGANTPIPETAFGVRVTGATLALRPLAWYSGRGGTVVIGTHTDPGTTIPSTWAQIAGKTTSTQRIQVSGIDVTRQVDLGIVLGDALRVGTFKGLLLGPGPTDSKNWWGAFASGGLTVTLRLEWYEP